MARPVGNMADQFGMGLCDWRELVEDFANPANDVDVALFVFAAKYLIFRRAAPC